MTAADATATADRLDRRYARQDAKRRRVVKAARTARRAHRATR